MASTAARDLASVRETIYQAISAIRLIDPHTHINPHAPSSQTLADILGYHYYTELVHSSGMPRGEIEEPGIPPRELVRRMVGGLGAITNTANHHWLIQICREFFDFQEDAITPDNWEALYDTAESKMASADWTQSVLDTSNVEAVFLTNDFDDDLEGFDTRTYIPCLRTDDLVFHLAKPEVRERLQACSGVSLDGSLTTLRAALQQRFEHFVANGARACAISIPPSFEPTMVGDGRAATALDEVFRSGTQADPAHLDALSRRVFWTLAELCDQFGLPFDLMIGVNRGVYPAGVHQGRDLYDSRVSLIQYRHLFNAFPQVKFPISVLASVTNQELVSYSWIFPNVLTNGHWWYSNTPSFIHRDASARLEAVPRNKQIGYYSDAYKLEFVLPKFDMYRRVLSRILAEEFVGENGWNVERAISLGRQVLRGNVDEVFRSPFDDDDQAEPVATPAPAVVTTDPDAELGLAEEELDPVPSEHEIESVELADVELAEGKAIAGDTTSLETEIDDVPLDVGDLLGEEDQIAPGPDTPGSQIHLLAGDGEFTPDSDSMRLKPDPLTGELQFPVDEDETKD
jgi:glucuronate isomerase